MTEIAVQFASRYIKRKQSDAVGKNLLKTQNYMKNINKKGKFNIDVIAEARKDKNFKKYSEGAEVRLNLALEVFNSRESMKLSQQRLAREISTTQKIISNIENGDVNIGIELLNRISKKLNFNSDNFVRVFGCPASVRIFPSVSNITVSMPNSEGVTVNNLTGIGGYVR